jgi:hypothetical protein
MSTGKNPFFDPPGKNDPHIHVLEGFTGVGWDKPGGKMQLDLRAFGGL